MLNLPYINFYLCMHRFQMLKNKQNLVQFDFSALTKKKITFPDKNLMFPKKIK